MATSGKGRNKRSKSGDRRRAPSSALLAAALASQSEGVLIMRRSAGSRGLPIVYANDRFCEMTGYSRKQILGRLHGCLHDDAVELVRMRAWMELADEDGDYEGEGDLLGKDGKAMQASWSYRTVAEKGGTWTHLVAIYRDVTERNRMQEALMTAQRLDAVGRMAGGVAHDFNNLLSVINGYCQMLGAKLAGQTEWLRDLEEIQKAGLKASGLTRQLLALGRKQPMVQRIFDLNEFLRGNAEILTRVVGEAGRLEFALDEALLPVKTDSDQLQQVLLNLALNARDALRAKGCVTVASSLREVSEDDGERGGIAPGSYAVLTMKDNGVGMDADTMAHIFEPFFTTKNADKGSGLGLALVYGIVQQSAGHIRVSSALLVGSTFDIYLPLCRQASEPSPRRSDHGHARSTRGHETVLLIEPDIILSKMLSGMLAAEGYRVLEAGDFDGAKAITAREDGPIHLLLGAIADEEVCGHLHRLLLKDSPGLKVLCTSSCGKDCAAANFGPGCQSCMPKPFAISELLKAVRTLLDH